VNTVSAVVTASLATARMARTIAIGMARSRWIRRAKRLLGNDMLRNDMQRGCHASRDMAARDAFRARWRGLLDPGVLFAPGLEHAGHGATESVEGEWLGDEHGPQCGRTQADGFVGEGRHNDDGEVATRCAEGLDDVEPRSAGRPNIGDDDVDGRALT